MMGGGEGRVGIAGTGSAGGRIAVAMESNSCCKW
jgi:hypothetical protein